MKTDEQVELVRGVARQYPRLTELTRFPATLQLVSPGKIIDQIRTLALAYIVNETIDRTLKDNQSKGAQEENQKQNLTIPRTIISPFVGIPTMAFDPTDLVGSSL